MFWAHANRKRESAVKLGPAALAVTLCAVFAMLGVGYVWYKDQIEILGRQKKELETRLADLQRDNLMRRNQLAQLCSPVALDARVRQLRLDLGPPALTQIVSIVERDPAAARRQALVSAGTHNE